MIKLYDLDSYTKEFTAIVTACEKNEDGNYRVILDQTAFFPTAGGQTCDTGVIGEQAVLDVIIENEIIIHIVKNPVAVGETVACKIDWEIRFRKMQHHSAEHIVSGIATKMFGCDNVGFHLSDKEVTIDYNKEFTESQLLLLEQKANEAIWDNLEIDARYPDESELPNIPYRAKLDLTENVRIVTIPGIDVCACCAPHIKRTGEIGVIHLKDMMRHRGGVRIRMICGRDALLDYEEKAKSVLSISNLLSAKQEEVADATENLLSQIADRNRKIAELSKNLAVLKAESIEETQDNICIFEESSDVETLRLLANLGKKKTTKMCCVLSGNDANGYSYIIASENINLREISKDINTSLSGRGGGREDMIQGSFSKTKEEIEKYFGDFQKGE
ncbi:MAG: hypothetical protein IKY39_00455 [Clostridia bacterium]|nr:hypothetical protein [Clostridia bacterium]